MIIAILPRPVTLAAATVNAVLATLALGTKPVTLAPAIEVRLDPLPENRLAVITLAPILPV